MHVHLIFISRGARNHECCMFKETSVFICILDVELISLFHDLSSQTFCFLRVIFESMMLMHFHARKGRIVYITETRKGEPIKDENRKFIFFNMS